MTALSQPTLSSAQRSRRFFVVQGSLLAFVAGYADVVGFCAFFGLFTAHVTGNFVMIGVELAGTGGGVLTKILALPVFALAVASTKLVVVRLSRRGVSAISTLLFMEAVLMIAFMIAGLHAAPVQTADAPSTMIAGLIGVAALGVQNAQGRLVLSDQAPTTIMTGNTTQIVIDLVEVLLRGPQMDAARANLKKMVPPLFGFASGAVLGALAFSAMSFWCLLPLGGILTALAIANR